MNSVMPVVGQQRELRFGLAELIYTVALIASAFATFGPCGIILAALVFGIWLVVFQRRLPTLVSVTLIVLFAAPIAVALMLPAIGNARLAARRTNCVSQLRQIAVLPTTYVLRRKR
jgi:hypothetical protein